MKLNNIPSQSWFSDRPSGYVIENHISLSEIHMDEVYPLVSIHNSLVELDHAAVVFPNRHALLEFRERAITRGATEVEPLGLFPRDFCRASLPGPDDLAFHFASIHLPTDLTLVLSSPNREGDQLSRFHQIQGPLALHHVAVSLDRDAFPTAIAVWKRRGYLPISPLAEDGMLTQMFLRRQGDGQILELIHRPSGSPAGTFTCTNITALRRSE